MFLNYLLISLLVMIKSHDLFEEYYPDAEKFMKKMTLEQKIGQMFFPRFDNLTMDKDIKETYPGGFVLFGKDFNDSEKNIIDKIDHIQKLSTEVSKLPLGLAVDEEGGTVNRISRYFREEKFPSPQDIYDEKGIEGVLEIDQEKRDLLRKFKMNVNLAPVADISYNESDYIYDRTLGKDPNETAEYIKSDVAGYVKDHFTCCAKHFPGYGNNINTHTGIAIDERPYEQFLEEDFLTFQAGIEEQIPMILVSHNIVNCKDKKYPASISKAWHDVLRNELGHTGLILTDDLSMDAIKLYTDDVSPAVIAVNAGNDILLTSDYEEHLKAVIESAKNGTISIETIDKACKRVIAWKIKYLGAKDNIDDEEKKNKILLYVCIGVGALILLIVIVFVLVKFCCKRTHISSDALQEIGDGTPFVE